MEVTVEAVEAVAVDEVLLEEDTGWSARGTIAAPAWTTRFSLALHLIVFSLQRPRAA